MKSLIVFIIVLNLASVTLAAPFGFGRGACAGGACGGSSLQQAPVQSLAQKGATRIRVGERLRVRLGR